MTDLETRLRDLADLDPGPVDPSALAEGARRRSARARRRTASGWAAALVVVLLVGLGISWLTADRSKALPVRPAPTASSADLCRVVSEPAPPGVLPDAPLSEQWSTVALCPQAPDDPAWAQLPRPLVVTGQAVDAVALTGGGPPIEVCDRARPPLPSFRLLLTAPGRPVYAVDRSRLRCGGHIAAQSFAFALAEQDLARRAAAGDPTASCRPLMGSDPADPPRRFSGARTVEVCVHTYPYAEAEPAPLRYRPVETVVVDGADALAVLDGLASAVEDTGRYTDCPWRGTWPVVAATTGQDRRTEVILRCEQVGPDGLDGRWTRLAGRGQEIVQQIVRSRMDPDPAP